MEEPEFRGLEVRGTSAQSKKSSKKFGVAGEREEWYEINLESWLGSNFIRPSRTMRKTLSLSLNRMENMKKFEQRHDML